MKSLKKHMLAIFSGNYKQYDIYLCLAYFIKTRGKKNIFKIFNEMVILILYWKTFPYQYFQYDMFLKEYTYDVNYMKGYLSSRKWIKITDKNAMEYKILCDDKALFSDLVTYYQIAHPHVFLKSVKGVFYNCYNRIIQNNEVDYIIANQVFDRVFVKDSLGWSGNNIILFVKKTDGFYYDSNSDRLSFALLQEKYNNSYLIFQEGIKQHDKLMEINPDSVNTIRFLTQNISGNIKIIATILRVGRKGRYVDNAHAGGITIEVNTETGALGKYARAYYDNNKYFQHPDTGYTFDGNSIPNFDEAKLLVNKLAEAFYQFKYIGWDIVVTDEKVIVLEMNKRPCIYLMQMTCGGLADKILK